LNRHRQALEQFFFLADGPRWLIRGPTHPSPRHRFEHVEVERLLDEDGKGIYRKRFLKTASGADYSYWTEREIRFVSHFASVKTPQVARPKLVEYGSTAVKQVDTQDAGPSLDNWLKLRVSPANRPDRVGPVFADLAEVARLLCACINALHELHRHGIVHCDLKADNICLGYVGAPLGADGLRLDYGKLSLIDFAFSVWPGSRTWELAQALPIDPDAAAADYVSPFFKAVLREDRHQQPPQAWQRLNYSVDWYALAVMLRKLLELLDSQRRDISGENPLESFLYGLADEWQTQYANGEIPATLPHQAEIARIQARFSHVDDWTQSGRFVPREAPNVQVAAPTPVIDMKRDSERPMTKAIRLWHHLSTKSQAALVIFVSRFNREPLTPIFSASSSRSKRFLAFVTVTLCVFVVVVAFKVFNRSHDSRSKTEHIAENIFDKSIEDLDFEKALLRAIISEEASD